MYLGALGIVNGLGRGKEACLERWLDGGQDGVIQRTDLTVDGAPNWVSNVTGPLTALPARLAHFDSRNARLLMVALEQIRDEIDSAIRKFGRNRIAVVMGTSTSGTAEAETAIAAATTEGGVLPLGFDMRRQELGAVAEFAASYFQVEGPALTISTACSSGSQALSSGRRLLRTGLADVVIAGGVDTLCQLTVNGFRSLSAVSDGICNPFSRNRDGTMIGEGAAVFLMQREQADVALMGVGSSSDAYNMTAPSPDGTGIDLAIRQALADAKLTPKDIDFIELHGTGTLQNDLVESLVVRRIFGDDTPSHSSKAQIGHCLGTAGSMGAAICWLLASDYNTERRLPPHIWDGVAARDLLSDCLTRPGAVLAPNSACTFLCNTLGFGGNNVSLVIGWDSP